MLTNRTYPVRADFQKKHVPKARKTQGFARVHAGILLMVSKALCPAHLISHRCLHPGRLLHARLHLAQTTVDVVGLYQFAWNTAIGKQDNIAQRSKLWQALQSLLQELPARNLMMLAGDFNTDLKPRAHQVGPAMHPTQWNYSGSHRLHTDQSEFQSLVQEHQLVALNTWDSQFAHTFVGNMQARSRIDFVLTRLNQSDSEARHATLLHTCALLDLKDGPHHLPIFATLKLKHPFRRTPNPNKTNPAATRRMRHMMQCAYIDQSTQWMHFSEPQQLQLSLPNTYDHAQTNEVLCHHVLAHFAPQRTVSQRAWQDPGFVSSTKQMWALYNAYKTPRLTTCANIFQLWFKICRFQRLQRDSKKLVAECKKKLIQNALEIASHFAHHKDAYQWFRSIEGLKNKQRPPVIQIRGMQGQLLTPTEECNALGKYFKELYHDPFFHTQHYSPVSQIPFTESELCHALLNLPKTKASPPHCAPNIAWSTFAYTIGPKIYAMLQEWWCFNNTLFIPEAWLSAWLVLIPKPHQTPDKPSALRPISLLDPVSKAITSLLVARAQDQCMSTLISAPQFAFMPQRTTSDSLLRVFAHCRRVREMTKNLDAGPNLHYHAQHHETFRGGMQISLDLQKAFDSVDRQKLIEALQALPLRPDLQTLLSAWLNPSRYHIHHKGNTVNFLASKGLRQGSTEPPFEWSALTWFVCQMLRHVLPESWIQECLTIFADDFHGFWEFQTTADVHHAVKQLRHLLTCLNDLGLKINCGKSAILLRLKGPGADKILSKYLRRTGKGPFFTVKTIDNQHCFSFPVVAKHAYLGCIISYGSFEDETLHRRTVQCQTLFRQLRPILCDRRCHSLQARLNLYDLGVQASLNYGSMVAGLTRKGALKYHALVMQHIRIMARSPRHITRESNVQLMTRLGRELPLHHFSRLHQRWSMKFEERRRFLIADHDVLHFIPSPTTPLPPNFVMPEEAPAVFSHEVKQQTVNVVGKGLDLTSTCDTHQLEHLVSCLTCGQSFEDSSALRIHCTKMNHTYPFPTQPRKFNLAFDSLEGLPQCRHCCSTFTTWRCFKSHIELGRCTAPPFVPSQNYDPRPVVFREDYVKLVQARSFAGLFANGALMSEIANNCVLCGQWCADAPRLTRHYTSQHMSIQAAAKKHYGYLKDFAAIGHGHGHCRLCQKQVQRLERHRCSAYHQLAVLHECVNIEPGHEVAPPTLIAQPPPAALTEADTKWTCHICKQPCKTELGLRQHRQRSKKCKAAPAQSQCLTKCGLCGNTYKHISALKRHFVKTHPGIPVQRAFSSVQTQLTQYFVLPNCKASIVDCVVKLSWLSPTCIIERECLLHKEAQIKLNVIYASLRHCLPQERHLHRLLGMHHTGGNPPIEYIQRFVFLQPFHNMHAAIQSNNCHSWATLLRAYYRLIGMNMILAHDSELTSDPWLELICAPPDRWDGFSASGRANDGHERSISILLARSPRRQTSFRRNLECSSQNSQDWRLSIIRLAGCLDLRASQVGPPPRAVHQRYRTRLLMDDVHEHGRRLDHPLSGSYSSVLEAKIPAKADRITSETSPLHHAHDRAPGTNTEDPSRTAARPCAIDSPAKRPSFRPRTLELHPVVSKRPVPQAEPGTKHAARGLRSSHGHHHANAEAPSDQPNAKPTKPQHHTPRGGSDTMEDRNLHENPRRARLASGPAEVDSPCSYPDGAHVSEASFSRLFVHSIECPPIDESVQRAGQRQDLCRSLRELKVFNPSNLCWLNSIWLSFGHLWGTWQKNLRREVALPRPYDCLDKANLTGQIHLLRHLNFTFLSRP